MRIVILMLFLFTMSCKEKTPELKSLGESNINQANLFKLDQSNFNINDPTESITITGVCDPRYQNMEVSFDGTNWKTFTEHGTTNTEDNCQDGRFTLYLDAINKYFTYDTAVVGNQAKTLKIRGNLGFTYSSAKEVSIVNGDFIAPATPTIRTLSSFAFARIYIDPIADSDFNRFECKVDSGAWYTCSNEDNITTDGSTQVSVGQAGDISVRAVDNTGNVSEVVTKPFVRGKMGRGVSGYVTDVVEYKPGQYLIAGDFDYHSPIPANQVARFNMSDFSFDRAWNPDFSGFTSSYIVNKIMYSELYNYFIVGGRNKAAIFDANWNLKNTTQFIGLSISSTVYPEIHNDEIYTKYSFSTTNRYYRSKIDNSDPSAPVITQYPDYITATWSASSYHHTSNYVYMKSDTGTTANGFCITRYNLDLSDHASGTNVICNNPNDFSLDHLTLGIDNNSAAYIGYSLATIGDKLFISGDFNNFKGMPVPNCVMTYDGTNFAAFGEDLGHQPIIYGNYNRCTSTTRLNVMDNNLLLRRYVYAGYDSISSTYMKTLKFNATTGQRDVNFPENINFNSTEKIGNYFKYGSILYDNNGAVYKSLSNLTNSTNPWSFEKNGYLYLYYGVLYANDPSNTSKNLILVDENGNVLKTFNVDGTVVNKIYKHGDNFYIAGNFNSVDGQTHKNLAKLDKDLNVDTSFPNFQFNSQVSDVAIDSQNRLYVAGQFTAAKDVIDQAVSRKYLMRFQSNYMFDSSFIDFSDTTINNPGSYSNGIKILLDEDTVNSANSSFYISGHFTTAVNGHETDLIAKYDLNGNIDTNFSITGTWYITDLKLAPNGNDLLISRYYSSNFILNGSNCELCVVNKNTGALVSAAYDSSRDVFDIEIHNGEIYIIGEIIQKLDSSYNLISSASGGSSTTIALRRFTVNANGELIIGGDFEAFGGNPRHNLMKLNSDFSLNTYSFGDWR